MKGAGSMAGSWDVVLVGPAAQVGQGPGVVVQVAETLGSLPKPDHSRKGGILYHSLFNY